MGIAYRAYVAQKRATRKRQRQRQGTWVRAQLDNFFRGGCQTCGSHKKLLSHHIDPATKLFDLSTGLTHRWGKAKFLREMAKCIPMCRSCHNKLHAEWRKEGRA